MIDIKKILVRNTFFQGVAQGLVLGLSLLTHVLLSRHLGVEDYGQYQYLFAFFYFFLTLSAFGIQPVVVRNISRHPDRAEAVLGSMMSFKLAISLICTAAAWVIIAQLDYSRPLKLAMAVYALVLPLNAFQLHAAMFEVKLDQRTPSIIGIGCRVLSFLLVLLTVLMKEGILVLMIFLVIVEMVYTAALVYFAGKYQKFRFAWAPGIWKEVLSSSWVLGVNGLCIALINRIDFLMLERMRTLNEVGFYSAAYRVTNLVETFPIVFMGTLYPLMSRLSVGEDAKLKRVFVQSTLLLGFTGLVAGAVILVSADPLTVLLFGTPFHAAGRGLAALIGSSVFVYFSITSSNFLNSIGHEKTNLGIYLVAVCVNIALNLCWIPVHGFVGAAWATTVTYSFVFLSQVTAAFYQVNRRMPQREAGA